MDIDTDDDILRKAAKDGSMDYSSWPSLLPTVVSRIEKIAHSEFPIPRIPPPRPAVRPPSPRFLAPLPSSDPAEGPGSSDTAASSQETNKENAVPSSSAAPTSSQASHSGLPPAGAGAGAAPAPAALPPIQPPVPHGSLPTPVAHLLDDITSTLADGFSRYPPHTIQRLAELLLYPRQHYRSLVPYLHALDRIVRVTSGANTYPLPPAVPDMSAMRMLANGVSPRSRPSGASASSSVPLAAPDANIGSDEALGGALLTPIPWLAKPANGDPDGSGSESGGSSPAAGSSQGQGQCQDQGQGQGSLSPTTPQQQQQQRSSSRSPQPGNGGGGSGGGSMEGQVRTESTETIDGPNGMGSIETVSVSVNGVPSTGAGTGTTLASRGVTQGELLRQEQRAGVVPVSQLGRHGHGSGGASGSGSGESDADTTATSTSASAAGPSSSEATPAAAAASSTGPDGDAPMTAEESEVPHARGPEEIGAADMGPQKETTSVVSDDGGVAMHGIDVERAVGRRSDNTAGPQQGTTEHHAARSSPKREAAGDEEETGEDESRRKKLKEGAATESRDDGIPAGGAEEKEEEGAPKKDAEGDVIITDPGGAQGPGDDTAAGTGGKPAAADKSPGKEET